MITKTEKKKINKTVLFEDIISIQLAVACIIITIVFSDAVWLEYSKRIINKNFWVASSILEFYFAIALEFCLAIVGASILRNIHKQKKCLIKMFECLNKVQSNIGGNNIFEALYIENPQ